MAEQEDLPARLAAVARQHGVDPEQLQEVPGGVANRAFTLGESLFLRVSRPGYEADLHKETQVVPAARSVGVLTPEIVAYDPTRTLLPTPYLITRRVHGTEPTDLPKGLAEQLAHLHRLRRPPTAEALPGEAVPGEVVAGEVVAGEVAGLPEDGWSDPWRTIDDLADRGYVDPGRRPG